MICSCRSRRCGRSIPTQPLRHAERQQSIPTQPLRHAERSEASRLNHSVMPSDSEASRLALGQSLLPQVKRGIYLWKQVSPFRIDRINKFVLPTSCFTLDVLFSFNGLANVIEVLVVNKFVEIVSLRKAVFIKTGSML